MLAQRTSANVKIDALEIQHGDAEQAKRNATTSPWNERITVHEIAAQAYAANEAYDLIVSNPPYFINSWLPPSDERTRVRHTETLTYQDLLVVVQRLLHPQGRFAVILPVTEGIQFIDIAKTLGLFCIRQCEFKTRSHKPVERLLLEFSYRATTVVTEELLLYESGDIWSAQYKALTAGFYLKI
jgi:tRNA1Val (adenine37-N6)-methyltransferase